MKLRESLRDEWRQTPVWLRVAVVGPLSLFLGALLAQMTLHRDAPIRADGDGFVGKYGARHTAAEFERYRGLDRIMLASAVAGFSMVVVATVRRRTR